MARSAKRPIRYCLSMKTTATIVGVILGMSLVFVGCGALGKSCEDNSDEVLDAIANTLDDAPEESQ